ncbi:S1 family peptidase [Streptomyces sp. NPDC015139]|uniref:S1 family peptidase n=1 Tax=Streptomyces sp. NPDC015139 TaxID=3364942 RepID=UPI0036FEB655
MRTSRLITACAATAISALALLAPAASAAPQADPPVSAGSRIVGGGQAANGFGAVRMIKNGRGWCSASIIAPTWVLTAKHCVGGAMSFRIGSLNQSSGGTVANGTQVFTGSGDLALVRLDRAVSATYARLGQPGTVRAGSGAQVYGWGATRPGSQCNGGEAGCQSPTLKVANVTVTGFDRDAAGGSAIAARSGDGVASGGDSGGPMMVNGVQVGVASTSDRVSRMYYTDVTAYRPWIRSITGV